MKTSVLKTCMLSLCVLAMLACSKDKDNKPSSDGGGNNDGVEAARGEIRFTFDGASYTMGERAYTLNGDTLETDQWGVYGVNTNGSYEVYIKRANGVVIQADSTRQDLEHILELSFRLPALTATAGAYTIPSATMLPDSTTHFSYVSVTSVQYIDGESVVGYDEARVSENPSVQPPLTARIVSFSTTEIAGTFSGTIKVGATSEEKSISGSFRIPLILADRR